MFSINKEESSPTNVASVVYVNHCLSSKDENVNSFIRNNLQNMIFLGYKGISILLIQFPVFHSYLFFLGENRYKYNVHLM